MTRTIRRFATAVAVVATSAFTAPPALAQGVPSTVAFTGRLVDDGETPDASYAMTFRLFGAASGGAVVWSESHDAVAATGGLVFVALGERTPLDELVLSGDTVWLEVEVDGEVLSPRLSVHSVPYAIRAGVAANADTLGDGYVAGDFATVGHDHAGQYLPVGGSRTCAADQQVIGIDVDGDVVCGPDIGGTSYRAGDGLVLTGDSDTFAVDFGDSGAATTAARTDHDHAGDYLPVGTALSCASGDVVHSITTGGDVFCVPDADTTYTAGTGLAMSADNQLSVDFSGAGTAATAARSDHSHAGAYLPVGSSLSCPSGQVVTAIDGDGDVVCAEDADTTLALAGGGTAATAARSDHTHANYLPTGTTTSCPTGERVTGISTTTGNVTCAVDIDTDTNTTYSAGSGIDIVGTTISVEADIARKSGSNQNFDSGTLYLDYGANRVGVGDSTPSTKLDVNGDVAASGYTLRTPRNQWISITGGAFAAHDSNGEEWSTSSFGWGYISGGPSFDAYVMRLTAPVHLPDGANVTHFACYFVDDDPTYDPGINGYLYERSHSSTGPTLLGSVGELPAGRDTATIYRVSDTSIAAHTVDNEQNTYFIYVSLSTPELVGNSGQNVRFYGCRVQYSTSLIQP